MYEYKLTWRVSMVINNQLKIIWKNITSLQDKIIAGVFTSKTKYYYYYKFPLKLNATLTPFDIQNVFKFYNGLFIFSLNIQK